jgi:hypothetical protein
MVVNPGILHLEKNKIQKYLKMKYSEKSLDLKLTKWEI